MVLQKIKECVCLSSMMSLYYARNHIDYSTYLTWPYILSNVCWDKKMKQKEADATFWCRKEKWDEMNECYVMRNVIRPIWLFFWVTSKNNSTRKKETKNRKEWTRRKREKGKCLISLSDLWRIFLCTFIFMIHVLWCRSFILLRG